MVHSTLRQRDARSPSQWPGTARSSTLGGRWLISTLPDAFNAADLLLTLTELGNTGCTVGPRPGHGGVADRSGGGACGSAVRGFGWVRRLVCGLGEVVQQVRFGAWWAVQIALNGVAAVAAE